MTLEGLCSGKTLATFGIINVTDSLKQNITKIVFLVDFFGTILIHARANVSKSD